MILFHRIFFFQEETKLLLSGLAGLLLLLGTSESWWWGSDLSSSARSVADVTVMDGSRDAVVLLQVNLWDGVVLVDRSLGKITHGSRVDHVADHVLFDGLVLWDAGGRVLATDEADVSTALLVCFAENPQTLAQRHPAEYAKMLSTWKEVYGEEFVDKAATLAHHEDISCKNDAIA